MMRMCSRRVYRGGDNREERHGHGLLRPHSESIARPHSIAHSSLVRHSLLVTIQVSSPIFSYRTQFNRGFYCVVYEVHAQSTKFLDNFR